MASKGVRVLRSVIMSGNRTLSKQVLETTMNAVSNFNELSPKEVSSLLTSVSLLRQDCPIVLRSRVFTEIASYGTITMFHSMNNADLARTVVSVGFLAKQLASSGTHLRVSSDLLTVANERVASINDAKTIYNLIRGFAMMRLPLSGSLCDFFRSVNTSALGFEESVFALKAGVDYGFIDKSLLSKILGMDEGACSPTAARSLLYCAAMAGLDNTDTAHVTRLLLRCNVDEDDMRSLVPLWASTALGVDVLGIPGVDAIVRKGLVSGNARDREMASYIAKVPLANREVLHQSEKHRKLRTTLEREYGSLLYEYEITPGIVVDCANVEKKLAIELDGPSHYLIDLESGGQEMNGPTKRKVERIRQLGWKVVNMSISRFQNSNRTFR